jgi:hypothetical protein
MDHDLTCQVASTTRSILQTRRLAQRLRVETVQQLAQIAASRRRIEDSVSAIHRAEQALAVLHRGGFDEPHSPEDRRPVDETIPRR